MAARRQFQRGRRPFRPGTGWAGLQSTVYTVVGGATKVLLATFVPAPGEEAGVTVRRVRGLLSIVSDQAAAVESQFGVMGFGVFNDTAIAAGVASLPDPVTDVQDDIWFVYVPFLQETDQSAQVGSYAAPYPFDSKAMRKVPQGYSVGVVLANAHATQSLKFAVNIRLLSSETSA